MPRVICYAVFLATIIPLPMTPGGTAAAKERALEDLRPPDVYEHVKRVKWELEYLRAHMGRSEDRSSELPVSDAEPREVFFQALTLFRKADRLCFEQVGTRGREPVPPKGMIRPGHVHRAVDAALRRILDVKKQLKLTREHPKTTPDPSKTPSDVFRSIVQANRQLNLMLERRVAPSDVFKQVTVAIAYAERLIEQFPQETSTVPNAPAYEPNKIPADVYRRLLGSFKTLQKITTRSGRKVLELGELDDAAIARVAPSDVYDIASLVVSELAYLHAGLPDAQPPRKVYDPGRKFPSDVFQRVGILEQQLARLASLVDQNPHWLKTGAQRSSPGLR